MAVVVARMVASLEAETSQFHARMTAAETQLSRWTSGTSSGRRATVMFQGALQQLSFQAAGIPGVVGKAASAIGILGLGTGPVMIAVAALGALSLIFNQAAKSAEEFVASANKVREFRLEHLKMLGSVGGDFQQTPAEQFATLLAKRTELMNQISARQALTESVVAQIGGIDPVAKRAASEIDALNASLKALNRTIADMRGPLQLQAIEALRTTIALERGGVFQGLRPGFQAGAFGVESGGALGLPGPSGPTFANIRHNVPRFVAPDTAPKPGFKMTPEFAIMSSMALLQGAQGGPAGFFGAAAGPIGMINPLAGAITTGVGGIFSMFDKSEERRHRELVEKLEHMAEEVGLERVTVVFTGPDGHQIRRSLAQLEAGDAVERIPGPVGAGG